MINGSIIHMDLHKPNNKLINSWNIFGAGISHGHTRTHKTFHDPDLRETITFPLIVFFVINHKGYIQMTFCFATAKLGVPKFPNLGLLQLWRLITSFANI
jgi:hypothetical protein